MTRLSERKFLAVLYLIILSAGLFLSWPSLSYYWFGDDLRLLRPYTSAELLASVTGNWDPSGLTTPGWRPLSTLFYHLQAVLFGESIELYRLFNIALFALHITLLMVIARELKLSRLTVLVGAVILVCSKNTWWVMVWPADSVRNPMGIFSSLAIYLLILYLKHPARWKFVLSLLFYAAALCTREEMLFYVGVIPAVAYLFLLQRDDLIAQPGRWLSLGGLRPLITYTLMISVLTIAFLIGRAHFVPAAPTTLSLYGLVFDVIAVLFPHLAAPSITVSIVLIILFWIVLIVMLRANDPRKRLLALFWLGCTLVACTPGLSAYRGNNLILPIGFFALFIAVCVVTFAQRSRAAAGFCTIVLVVFIGGSAYQHRLAQESLNPYSLEYIRLLDEDLWGKFANAGTPQVRIDHLWAEYHALGINPENYNIRIQELYEEAAREGRFRPDGDKPFAPLYASYLHPW